MAVFPRPVERDGIFRRSVFFVRSHRVLGCILFVYFHTVKIIILLAVFIFIAC